MRKKQDWIVYMLECGNGNLYTGITKDIDRRIGEHRSGRGARFTRAFGVEKLVYKEIRMSRSAALKREAEIKRLKRKEKLLLIRSKDIDI